MAGDYYTLSTKDAMKNILLIIVLSLATGEYACTQQMNAGFSTGLGLYSMADLKSVNVTLRPPFDSKLTSDFPPFLYFSPFYAVLIRQYAIGLTYTFQSTGSRISSRDYSGEYRLDMKVNSSNFGIYTAMNLLPAGKSRFSAYARPGIAFSNLRITEYLKVLNTVYTDDKFEFKAINFYFEPGLDYSYALTPSVSAGMNIGYYVQLGKNAFHLAEDSRYTLNNPGSGQPVKPGWSGFRFGLSLNYVLISDGF
jgi:hypothetical protein